MRVRIASLGFDKQFRPWHRRLNRLIQPQVSLWVGGHTATRLVVQKCGSKEATPMRPSTREISQTPKAHPIEPTTETTIHLTPFDQKEYRQLIEARGKTIVRTVTRLKRALDLSNALDAGCGVGFFSQTLLECGLNVCGFDGRGENVTEARRRFPHIPFEQGDIEERAIAQLGRFDFVLCFGLLYHLENPLLAIRNLRGLTEKCLLMESMCLPEEKSSMLLRVEPRQED